MTSAYTDADLRAEAARQHHILTSQLNGREVLGRMLDARVQSTCSADETDGLTWDEALNCGEFDEPAAAVRDLIRGAADVSGWAVGLGSEGLVPAEQRLVHSAEDGPVHAAFHIALDRRLELDARAYDAIADVIRAHLLIREDSTPAVEQPAAEACGKCKQPFDPADTRFDGRARYYLTPYCRGCVDRCHDSEIADHRCVICA